MKRLKGKLTISRPQRSDGLRFAEITLTDELSSCEAISIEVPLEEFAEALLGLGFRPCEFEFNDSGIIGMVRQYKTEEVTLPADCPYGEKQATPIIKKAVATFEVDDWKGSLGDARNHHHHLRTNKDGSRVFRVGFTRYVPVK